MFKTVKAAIRRLVKIFASKISTLPKKTVVRGFNDIGVSRSTVYTNLKDLENRGHVNRFSDGRKDLKMPVKSDHNSSDV